MIKVIVVNGRPGCGKTTFENLCAEKREGVIIKSTVDFVKEVAKFCGWNGQKTLKDRKFLSDLKKILTAWDEVPYKKIKEMVDIGKKNENKFYLFVDCREPEEIEKLKRGFDALTVLIRRPNDEETEVSNDSDKKIFEYNYDLTIQNNSDIIELDKMASNFMNYIDSEMNWLKGE